MKSGNIPPDLGVLLGCGGWVFLGSFGSLWVGGWPPPPPPPVWVWGFGGGLGGGLVVCVFGLGVLFDFFLYSSTSPSLFPPMSRRRLLVVYK